MIERSDVKEIVRTYWFMHLRTHKRLHAGSCARRPTGKQVRKDDSFTHAIAQTLNMAWMHVDAQAYLQAEMLAQIYMVYKIWMEMFF